jgi:hypothetical protein
MRTLSLCLNAASENRQVIWNLNFGLVKDSFPSRTVKVKPSGFLAKTFFLSIEIFSGKKLFAGNLDTSRPTR